MSKLSIGSRMKEQLPRRAKIARVHDVLPECNEITINLLPVCLQIVSEAASRIPRRETLSWKSKGLLVAGVGFEPTTFRL